MPSSTSPGGPWANISATVRSSAGRQQREGALLGRCQRLGQRPARAQMLLAASRITLAWAITKSQLRGTLETLMNQIEKARGAQPGATTDI